MAKIYSNSDEKFLRTNVLYGLNGFLYPTKEAAYKQVASERLDKKTMEYLFIRGMMIQDVGGGSFAPAMFYFDEGKYCSVALPNYQRFLYNDDSFNLASVFYSSEYTG